MNGPTLFAAMLLASVLALPYALTAPPEEPAEPPESVTEVTPEALAMRAFLQETDDGAGGTYILAVSTDAPPYTGYDGNGPYGDTVLHVLADGTVVTALPGKYGMEISGICLQENGLLGLSYVRYDGKQTAAFCTSYHYQLEREGDPSSIRVTEFRPSDTFYWQFSTEEEYEAARQSVVKDLQQQLNDRGIGIQ